MAIRKQLRELPIGTIITDKASNTEYIILETRYKVTGNRTSDGVLLGFYANGSNKYFVNQIFDSGTLGALYNNSEIKSALNIVSPIYKTSTRLKEYIIPTMVCGASTMYDLIGPMWLFLPSLIELGFTGTNIAGVVIDATNPIVNIYIQNLKTAKVLTRNSSGFDVFLADNTTVNMGTPQNLCYFLCADPTIYVGIDENNDYYLFDTFVSSVSELENAINIAQEIIDKYDNISVLQPSIDSLKAIIILGNQHINNNEDQETINQTTKDMLELIALVEVQIQLYELNQNRIIQNVNSINELITLIDNFIQTLTINGNISKPEIASDVTSLNSLRVILSTKNSNLTSGLESPMTISDLHSYLDTQYDMYFTIENSINQKLYVNETIFNAIKQLGILVQECINLIAKYPLVDDYYLQMTINDANTILSDINPSINTLQQMILNLSEQKQNFINNIRFEVDIMNPVLEIGLLGRRPTIGITLTNSTGVDAVATSSDINIVQVNSPNIVNNIIPVGSAKLYSLTGINEGTATVTFEIIENDINKQIIISVIVSKRDTIDPSYLDLIEDQAKVSIQQIDSGVKDISHLGIRLEEIEQKLFSSTSTLDPNLLNILNTTTPTPIINDIEMIIVKDANITTGLPTTITLANNYYIGKQHLIIYRNGVYQQLGVRYKEKTNNSVEFNADYLLPGDRLLFISGNNGMADLSQILIDYTDTGLITNIKFLKTNSIFREIKYIYNTEYQITQQIISDTLYDFIKDFTYNSNGYVTDINISVIKK